MIGDDLISVVVPVYNGEKYLAACLESIISQSYRNIEIIVINDGSTDHSLNIAESFALADDRIKVFTYNNEGLAEARNHGISLSTGNFICFVDADDILLPEALQTMQSVANETSSQIIEGKIIFGNYNKQSLDIKNTEKSIYSAKDAIERVLYQKTLLSSPCGKLFRKNLFENEKFKRGILYEDLDIFYRIYIQVENLIYINFPVYYYRTNEESITHTWNLKRLDVLEVTKNIEQFIEEKIPEILLAAKDRRLSANFNMFALCSIHGEKERAAECWELIKKYRKQSLLNPRVRTKNKAGILLSYFGPKIFKFASNMIYR